MSNLGIVASTASNFLPDSNTIVFFQDDTSEEIPLAHRPRRAHPTKLAVPASQSPNQAVHQPDPAVVDAVAVTLAVADVAAPVIAPAGMKTTVPAATTSPAPVEARVTPPEMVPPAEPEATAKTPVHPQDVDLGIPLQEVTSAYVRIPIFLCLSYAFS